MVRRLISYIKKINFTNFKRAVKYYKIHGFKKFLYRLTHRRHEFGVSYDKWFRSQRVNLAQIKVQHNHIFPYKPLISIVVPTYNTPIKYFKEMLLSVKKQTYSNWELCIADGSCNNKKLRSLLHNIQTNDSRIKVVFLEKNLGISDNTNAALNLASGEYVGLFDHDDILEPDCLFEVITSLNDRKYDILYTDEDKVNRHLTQYGDPNFKPDWSPDLFYSHNYITHFFVVKKSIIDMVGGFRKEFDGAQDYDLMFRCIEQAETIKHIPRVLYHWRMHNQSTAENPESKLYVYEAGRKAIEEHYKRVGIKAKVKREPHPLWGMYHTIYETTGNPLVSIVIPNMDHTSDLRKCITSLYEVNRYTNFEIIIVENNSKEKQTFAYYDEVQKKYKNVKVVFWEGEFNYSAINNYGTTFAKGQYFLFLNNDTEMIEPMSLSELLGNCIRDDVGIVGAKLLYDDDTVQHAGVVIGFSGFAGHVNNGIDSDHLGYKVRALINSNYSAVTAACMLVKRSVFMNVNGFDEGFKVALNDIDFCLRVRELGYLVVFNSHSLWYHFESKSRGYETTPEKEKRFKSEIKKFRERWLNLIESGDPYYNPNFEIALGPFQLKLKDRV